MTVTSNTIDNKGDFKDQQFAQAEVADKVVEQCEFMCRWIETRSFSIGCSSFTANTVSFHFQTMINMPAYFTNS